MLKRQNSKIIFFDEKQQERIRKANRAKRINACKKHAKSVLLMTSVVALACALQIKTHNVVRENEMRQHHITALQEEIKKEEARKETLVSYNEYETSYDPAFVEEVAREKLGYVYPNEIVFEKE